jgi:hypothetical protein
VSVKKGGRNLSGTIVTLILQIIAGAIGGNVAAAGMNNVDLGKVGSSIAGALGGGGGGTILGALAPSLTAAASGVDFKTVIAQVVGGSVGGAILTVIVGMLKGMMAKQQRIRGPELEVLSRGSAAEPRSGPLFCYSR